MPLVLSRIVGELIFVGPDVVIRVTRARGGVASLATEAPREVEIMRSELVPDDDPRWANVPDHLRRA